MAPAESRHTASRAPEPLRDDPFAELSPGTVSAAPLLHPQRQRELIEQAAGMSTRQVANLLAAAAPEVLPPRDTLRAAAPDRYTLNVSIDQECEQGLRLLKDLGGGGSASRASGSGTPAEPSRRLPGRRTASPRLSDPRSR